MSESLFTDQVPVVADASDGTPGITCGTTIRFAVAGSVTAVRFHTTATVSGAYSVRLDRVDAADGTPAFTALASAALDTPPSAGQWVTAPLPEPVPVAVDTLYRAAYFSGAGRYVATVGAFDGVDIVNGDLTAYRDGADPIGLGSIWQGTYRINAAAGYPDTSAGNGTNYFADVVFEPEGAGVGVSPQHVTLSADVESVLTFAEGLSRYRVTVIANPAVTYFNAKNAAVPAVASSQDGNEVLPAVLASFEGDIRMSGAAKVRLRSVGTPTVAVSCW